MTPIAVNKSVFKDFADKLLKAADAVQEGGLGMDDLDEGMALTIALPGVVGEIKKDKLSGLLALNEAISGAIVDERNADATA